MMSDNLTLPGTIPGLLRRGSPIILTEDYEPCASWEPYLPKGRDGVLLCVTPGEMQTHGEPRYWVAWEDAESDAESLIYMEPDRLALDLTDATGRAHAVWWLAKEKRLSSPTAACWRNPWPTAWEIQTAPRHHHLFSHERHIGHTFTLVATLGGLAGCQPRLLSDGSRWVDAEALRRVCLHVAGLEG